MKRGEIYWADLGDTIGSEEGGRRPVVIIQNNKGTKYSPTVIVAPITTKLSKDLPTHQFVKLNRLSVIMYEQIRTIDKTRISEYIKTLNDDQIKLMNYKIKISVGLIDSYNY